MTLRDLPKIHANVPNLAPMVNVVMVILIFFMLGTSFILTEGVLSINLPSQVGPGGASGVTLVPVVRIGLAQETGQSDCDISVMDRPLPENTFPALLSFMRAKAMEGADPRGRILIGAGPDVEYRFVISAMDSCVRAGFSNIQFSVPTGPTPAGGAS